MKDIYPGPESSMPKVESGDAVEINGILYFICDDPGSFDKAVWRTDGTAQGTWKLQPPALSQHASILEVGAGGDTLYFIITFSDRFTQETQLWKSNGTRDGTVWVKTILDSSYAAYYSDLYPLGDDVIFHFENQLWRSDGTETGTQSFMGLEWSDGLMDEVTAFGGRLYFSAPAPDGSDYSMLWYTDGTTGGTSQIQTAGATAFRDPGLFTLEGNDFYFVAHKHGTEGNRRSGSLWKIAAGESVVSLLADLVPDNPIDSSRPVFLTLLNDEKWMYLDYYTHASHPSRWHVVDVTTGISEPLCVELSCYPKEVTFTAAWNGKVYFMANELGDFYPFTMFVSDGTEAGTAVLNMPRATTPFYNARNFLSTPNAFYFSVDDGVHGAEAWVIRLSAEDEKIYLPMVRKQ